MTYDQFLKIAGQFLDLEWRKYRRRSARRHVEARLKELDFTDYGQYLERLCADPDEARRLPDLMRVTVSRFFREKSCWEELAEKVLPALLVEKDEAEPLRAWCVGSCNGEEPYSLAALFLWNFALSRAGAPGIEILATDIDGEVIARAREACYGKSALREVPGPMLSRYFSAKGDRFCVKHEIKNLVRFKKHNFMEEPVPRGMDLVLCRYLAFTYYLGRRRHRAAHRLWEAIRPGGALVIGRKETLGPPERELFEAWPGTEAIFQAVTPPIETAGTCPLSK